MYSANIVQLIRQTKRLLMNFVLTTDDASKMCCSLFKFFEFRTSFVCVNFHFDPTRPTRIDGQRPILTNCAACAVA